MASLLGLRMQFFSWAPGVFFSSAQTPNEITVLRAGDGLLFVAIRGIRAPLPLR